MVFGADEGGGGDRVGVEEDLVGVDGAAAHFFDAAEGEAWVGAVEGDAEEGEARAGFEGGGEGGGPREEDHLGGDLRAGDPDLLAGDEVAAVGLFGGCGGQAERVEARVGLGNTEADAPLA